MLENTGGRVTFLVNLMFRRLDKFDGPIFGWGWGWRRGRICGGCIFGMFIGLHIWGRIFRGAYIREVY